MDLWAAEKGEIVENLGRGMKTWALSFYCEEFCGTRVFMQIKAERVRFLPDMYIKLREQLLKRHSKTANRNMKLLVPLEPCKHQGSVERNTFCINLLFSHPSVILKSRGCIGPRNTWRLIFKRSYSLISAVKLLMDGWWIAHHVPKRWWRQQEAAESCFGPESSGEN